MSTARVAHPRHTRSRPHAARPDAAARPARRYTAPHGLRSALISTVGVLNVIGVVMVLSASSVVSLTTYGTGWYVFQRQLLWVVLGAIAFVVAARLDYRRWSTLGQPLLLVSGVLLLVVLVPGFGVEVSGARRWLGAGAVRFQPSEVAKLGLLVFCADLLVRREHDLDDWHQVLKPVLLVFAGIAALVVLEPDLDSTVLLGLIVASILVAGGIRSRHLASLAATGVGLAVVLAILAPYRRARVLTFLHPTADASNTGYQIVQSLIALGTGGVSGVGLGAGRAKWHFLPNAHTDFIFSIIGEELGLLGCFTVLGLFAMFAFLGVRIALRARDRFGMLLAVGITVWISAQAAINIGGVIGLLPVSGIPLPFISFGGSSLVFTMLASGILVNVARQAR